MSNLEEIIKQHPTMTAYVEEMANLTRMFEAFVYDNFNVNTSKSEISEMMIYSKNKDGKTTNEEGDLFGYGIAKGNNPLFLSVVVPLLSYMPEIKSEAKTEKAIEQMSEQAMADPVYIKYITQAISYAQLHPKDGSAPKTDDQQATMNAEATIKNLQYRPKEAFQQELSVFCLEFLMNADLSDTVTNYKSIINDKYTYIFKKKIYENIQKNYDSWKLFIDDLYGDKPQRAKEVKEKLYNAFRLPEEKEVIGDMPDDITDEDLGLNINKENDSENLANGLSPEELSQWTQVNRVWDALKQIKIDGETTFIDALYNAFASNKETIDQALKSYFRTISPKDGLIFRKGWSQQITTKFIQVLIVACIDDMINRGAYHGDVRMASEKLSDLQKRYQHALDDNNQDAIKRIKEKVQNTFGIDGMRKLEEMRPKKK